MATKKSAKVVLTAEQIELGSRFLTGSNLGQYSKDPETRIELNREWNRCLTNHEMEGISCDEEFSYWEKLLKAGDAYTVKELKTRIPWLFEGN